MAKTRLDCIMPEMPVRNLSAAVEFYTRVLGFRMELLHDNEYALMSRDGCRLGLSRKAAGAAVGTARFYALVAAGLDEYYEQVTAAGAKVVESLERRPYGMKDFLVVDPDGNHLAFGASI